MIKTTIINFTYNRTNILILILIILLPVFTIADIAGSDHDLTVSGRKLCETCHTPHNASGDALWSSGTKGVFSGVADLCFSCHDGTITSVGVTTVFDQSKEQHIMVGTDCSSSDGCHNVHTQNPNGTGRFLKQGIVRTNNSYCETCHNDTPFPGGEHLGVHTTDNSHYTDGTSFICESCHTIHGAVKQTINPPNLEFPILLADDNIGNGYGEFCISCHNGIAPRVAVEGTGGVASRDPYDYSELVNDGTESKHPTHVTLGAYPLEGCNSCHVQMCADMPALEKYDLKEDNTNSNYCVACHDSGHAPDLGEIAHFSQDIPNNISMNEGLIPALPWANQLDEDGNPGQDFVSATANMMTCETCHSVHRKGYVGSNSGYLLRYANDITSPICHACHKEN